MTLNKYSLKSMINVLEKDYGCTDINEKTVWIWRIKLIHAMASIKMPVLSGIIQVDETFIRESQKGSRHLVSYLPKDDTRKPRYGRIPSKLGVMGPEFVTVTTAIENTGYSVCNVSAMGKLTPQIFTDQFEAHFNNPAYLCTDANSVYERYCKLFDVPHYVKPSNYNKIIGRSGYITPDYSNPVKAAKTKQNNEKISEKLYNNELIDNITNRGYMTYEEFKEYKENNKLSLARVNSYIKVLKNLSMKI